MKIKGQLEWTDYLSSQLLHMRLGSFGTIALYGVLAVMVFGLIGGLFLAADGIFSIATMIPPFVFAVLVVLYRYVFLPKQIKKIFFQQKELSLPFEMEITETGIVASNELGNGIRPWVNFVKWKEDKTHLILYHSDIMYTIIPKRLFPDPQQVEIIKAHLEKNKIPIAKSQRRTTAFALYFLLLIVIATMLYMGFRIL
jgi:hypothetical protein